MYSSFSCEYPKNSLHSFKRGSSVRLRKNGALELVQVPRSQSARSTRSLRSAGALPGVCSVRYAFFWLVDRPKAADHRRSTSRTGQSTQTGTGFARDPIRPDFGVPFDQARFRQAAPARETCDGRRRDCAPRGGARHSARRRAAASRDHRRGAGNRLPAQRTPGVEVDGRRSGVARTRDPR